MRGWDTSQQAKCSGGSRAFYENGYPFSMLAIQFYLWKGCERNGTETKNQGRTYRGGKSAVSRIADA